MSERLWSIEHAASGEETSITCNRVKRAGNGPCCEDTEVCRRAFIGETLVATGWVVRIGKAV